MTVHQHIKLSTLNQQYLLAFRYLLSLTQLERDNRVQALNTNDLLLRPYMRLHNVIKRASIRFRSLNCSTSIVQPLYLHVTCQAIHRLYLFLGKEQRLSIVQYVDDTAMNSAEF